ncbi:unnamed protein product [Caenorhabditis auriculariae]|uniref:Protein kinase domain-containing protein n=1 Tax=Caenorhabditis auriculariae TaxID=2777116 RepID=A0A8S1GRQ1_9PELO|nr:unnamed protein product [Caenorhabditis auriculariae]
MYGGHISIRRPFCKGLSSVAAIHETSHHNCPSVLWLRFPVCPEWRNLFVGPILSNNLPFHLLGSASDAFRNLPTNVQHSLQMNVNPREHWNIIGELGDGAFGKVEKAVSRKDPTKFAASKSIEVQKGESLQDLLVEIDILTSCNHPGILQLLGCYFFENKLNMMLEFCGGGALDMIMLELEKGLTEKQIAVVARYTCEALQYLHQNHIIHRDLKAGNILLTQDGVVKVADFGVSVKMKDANEKHNTFIGTPYWMAPEVMNCETFKDSPYSVKVDIWSLGITLIECAQMEPPHSNLSPTRVLIKILKSDPPTLDRPSMWSIFFADFLKKSLVKNPNDRPSAAELLKHSFIREVRDTRAIQELLAEVNADVEEEEIVDDHMSCDESLDSDDHRVPDLSDSKSTGSRTLSMEKFEVLPKKRAAPPPPVEVPKLISSTVSERNNVKEKLSFESQGDQTSGISHVECNFDYGNKETNAHMHPDFNSTSQNRQTASSQTSPSPTNRRSVQSMNDTTSVHSSGFDKEFLSSDLVVSVAENTEKTNENKEKSGPSYRKSSQISNKRPASSPSASGMQLSPNFLVNGLAKSNSEQEAFSVLDDLNFALDSEKGDFLTSPRAFGNERALSAPPTSSPPSHKIRDIIRQQREEAKVTGDSGSSIKDQLYARSLSEMSSRTSDQVEGRDRYLHTAISKPPSQQKTEFVIPEKTRVVFKREDVITVVEPLRSRHDRSNTNSPIDAWRQSPETVQTPEHWLHHEEKIARKEARNGSEDKERLAEILRNALPIVLELKGAQREFLSALEEEDYAREDVEEVAEDGHEDEVENARHALLRASRNAAEWGQKVDLAQAKADLLLNQLHQATDDSEFISRLPELQNQLRDLGQPRSRTPRPKSHKVRKAHAPVPPSLTKAFAPVAPQPKQKTPVQELSITSELIPEEPKELILHSPKISKKLEPPGGLSPTNLQYFEKTDSNRAPPPEPPVDYEKPMREVPPKQSPKQEKRGPAASNRLGGRRDINRQTVTKKTRTYTVDGVQMTSTTVHVFGAKDSKMQMKLQLQDLRRLQRDEGRQKQELASEANKLVDEQTRKFNLEQTSLLRQFEIDMDLLERRQRKEIEDAETAQEHELKLTQKKLRLEQEKDLKAFRERMKQEMKIVKQEMSMLSRAHRKDALKMQREALEHEHAMKEGEYIQQLKQNYDAHFQRVLERHQESLAQVERLFLQQKHGLLRIKENNTWELEDKQMREKYILHKKLLKDDYYLIRTQMLTRHQRDLHQLEKIHQEEIEDLSRALALDRKKLPKALRAEGKTRSMMYKESLRISGQTLSPSELNDLVRQFEEKENARIKNAMDEALKKHLSKIAALKAKQAESIVELNDLQSEKRKQLLEKENNTLYEHEQKVLRNAQTMGGGVGRPENDPRIEFQ